MDASTVSIPSSLSVSIWHVVVQNDKAKRKHHGNQNESHGVFSFSEFY